MPITDDFLAPNDEDILDVPQSNKKYPLEGVAEWINAKNGFTIIDLDFRADPDKRSEEWLLQRQMGMPRSAFNREYGRSWVVYEGKPVYGDYNRKFHRVSGNIIASRKQKLISGYDAGPNDVYLAWVLGLVSKDIPAVIWIDEYLSKDGDVESFMEIVISKIRGEWAKLGGFCLHIADNSVNTKTRVTKERTAVIDVMRKFGVSPLSGEISFSARRQAVEDLLFKPIMWGDNGTPVPRLRVHERCVMLDEAMEGGYHYPKNISAGGGNMYRPLPEKNEFSHIANAMEYAASRISLVTMNIPYATGKLPKMTRI